MTDGTPFPPLDTLVSQKRKTEYQLPRRGRQAAPFSLSRKLRKSAKIVYNGLEIKNHITKERM